MNDEIQVLGWTTGQWWTVFAKYPPKQFDFKGVADSRKRWQVDNLYQPDEAAVTDKFRYHWGKFCKTLKVNFDMPRPS